MEMVGISLRHGLGWLGVLAGVVMSSAALFLAGLAALAVLAGAVLLLSTTDTCLSELLQDMLVPGHAGPSQAV